MTVRKETRKRKKIFDGVEIINEESTWRVDVTINFPDNTFKRIRVKSPVQTQRGATEYEQSVIQNELNRWRKGDMETKNKDLIFEEFVPIFLNNYAVHQNKPSELAAKEKNLRTHILPYFGKMKLSEITSGNVANYITMMKKKVSFRGRPLNNKTINNTLTILHKIMSQAKIWDYPVKVPSFDWLKVKQPSVKFFTIEQMFKLINAAEPEIAPMITLAYSTGMRQGELRALKWDSVDVGNKTICIKHAFSQNVLLETPKSGKLRYVPVSQDTLDMLMSLPCNGEFVFAKEDGSAYRSHEWLWPLRRACDKAGLPRIGWHAIRHSTGTGLVQVKQHPKVIQQILGHSTTKMTDRYMHVMEGQERFAIEALEGHVRNMAARVDIIELTSRLN